MASSKKKASTNGKKGPKKAGRKLKRAGRARAVSAKPKQVAAQAQPKAPVVRPAAKRTISLSAFVAESPPVEREDVGAAEAARHGITRSPQWPEVEQAHLKAEPACAACESGEGLGAPLYAHHIIPFHYCVALGRPDLELDARNLLTLCGGEPGQPGQSHHLLLGHLEELQSANLNAIQSAREVFRGMNREAIRADSRWQAERETRLKPLDQMTQEEKDALVRLMDERFPKAAEVLESKEGEGDGSGRWFGAVAKAFSFLNR